MGTTMNESDSAKCEVLSAKWNEKWAVTSNGSIGQIVARARHFALCYLRSRQPRLALFTSHSIWHLALGTWHCK